LREKEVLAPIMHAAGETDHKFLYLSHGLYASLEAWASLNGAEDASFVLQDHLSHLARWMFPHDEREHSQHDQSP
jgi:hypothetical protein